MALLSFGEHLEDHLCSSVREFTEKYGAKAGILEYLRQFPDLKDFILPGFYVSPEMIQSDRLPDLPSEFHLPAGKLLYRSTHPDDHRGYIGVLPTVSDVENSSRNEQSIENYLAWNDRDEYCILDAMNYRHKYGDSYPYEGHAVFRQGYTLSDTFESRWEKITSGECPMPDFDVEITKLLDRAKEAKVQFYSANSRYERNIRRQPNEISSQSEYSERRGLRGVEYTGIYIQPKIAPWEGIAYVEYPVGSVFENPHKPGSYVVSYRIPSDQSESLKDDTWGRGDYLDGATTLIVENIGDEYKAIDVGNFWRDNQSSRIPNFVYRILDIYGKVKEKQVFGKDYSFQMEFGFETTTDPLIYQIRQYAPFQTASFSLDPEDGISHQAIIRGITDETGITVRYIMGNTIWGDMASKSIPEGVSGIVSTNLKKIAHRSIPLSSMQFWSANTGSQLDLSNHAWFSYLFETGGVAIAKSLINGGRSHSSNYEGIYECQVVSDGVSCIISGNKRIDIDPQNGNDSKQSISGQEKKKPPLRGNTSTIQPISMGNIELPRPDTLREPIITESFNLPHPDDL